MTVPGLACAASSPTTSRTCASSSTVTWMMSAAATSATLSARLRALFGQRRHRLGPDVVNRYAAGPFGHLGGHRRAHVAQPDVAELQTVAHDRMTCPPSTLKIWPVIHDASSDNRNKHMPTKSSGVPIRDSGRPLTMSSTISLRSGGPVGLGVDGSGRYRVDPDVLAAQLAGQLLGEAVDADLGQAVEVRVQPCRSG